MDRARDTERDERLAELGEDALVARLLTRFGDWPPDVVVGPGDDAAVLDLDGPVVVSTDTLVEGQDFRHEWSGAHEVGVKLAAQNLADVAAMGAVPVALLVSLAAPGDLPARWASSLAEGLDEECRRAGAAVVGGDVSAAREVVLTGTALGVLHGPAVRRTGARPGDVVALAGRPGRSAAGLALLAAAVGGDDVADLLAAHRAPRPPYEAGRVAAAAGATAMIDTSDGLVRDAARLGSASGVVVDLDAEALAPSPELLAAAGRLGRPDLAVGWVLTGGEDHGLLACFPPGVAPPPSFTVVGVVGVAGPAGGGVLVDGRPWQGRTGWHHFGDPPA